MSLTAEKSQILTKKKKKLIYWNCYKFANFECVKLTQLSKFMTNYLKIEFVVKHGVCH